MDTRTGAILAAVEGDSKREEHVLPGAVSIAKRRTRKESRNEAIQRLQDNVLRALAALGNVEATEADQAPPD